MRLVIERWRPVVGYEDEYRVSDLGNVRSVDRPISVGNGHYRNKKGIMLKQFHGNAAGHCRVCLGENDFRWVHRLVLEAFVGPAPKGTEARHRDGNPVNNCVSNLCWDTRSRNMLDIKWHKGNKAAKLRPEDVVAMRGFFGRWSQRKIAGMFGISQSHVSRVYRGESHEDVE